MAFQKAKKLLNLTTESGSKQRFSSLQEKVVIHAVSPVLDLKGYYGYLGNVRKCQQPQTNTF